MKVKELKENLAKLSSEFDDLNIVLEFKSKDKLTIDTLCYLGYTKNFDAFVLGSYEAFLDIKKTKK